MKITTAQLEDIALCLEELADDARFQKGLTHRSIMGTNAIITIFTLLAGLIVLTIFYYFFAFNQGVSRSVVSMDVIQEQMTDLRDSMDSITFSVDQIGQNIGYIELMSTNISTIARSTDGITQSIQGLVQETKNIGYNTRWIRHHTYIIDQHFSNINYSIYHVSDSLQQTARPIERFLPLP